MPPLRLRPPPAERATIAAPNPHEFPLNATACALYITHMLSVVDTKLECQWQPGWAPPGGLGHLHYYRNRYYMPGNGIFTSRDQLLHDDNRGFIYVRNAPSLLKDPLGLKDTAHVDWYSCCNTWRDEWIDWIVTIRKVVERSCRRLRDFHRLLINEPADDPRHGVAPADLQVWPNLSEITDMVAKSIHKTCDKDEIYVYCDAVWPVTRCWLHRDANAYCFPNKSYPNLTLCPNWKELDRKGKKRAVMHELLHFGGFTDDMEPLWKNAGVMAGWADWMLDYYGVP